MRDRKISEMICGNCRYYTEGTIYLDGSMEHLCSCRHRRFWMTRLSRTAAAMNSRRLTMAKTKNKRPGKPRGMNYADMLARRKAINAVKLDAAALLLTEQASSGTLADGLQPVRCLRFRQRAPRSVLRGVSAQLGRAAGDARKRR